MNLLDFRKNVYSQNGEDGVLEYIFEKIADALPPEKWCVEFGAWDGQHLSNTFHLVEQGWNAVYIEGDDEKFDDLLKTSAAYPKIIPIKAMVGYEDNDSSRLDHLLEKTEIPKNFDLLSVDIDSYDLAVWQSFSGHAKVVVIEINSSVRPGIFQWHDGINFQGNSFSSTLEVAKNKGYDLVCHTGNLIFVRKDLVQMIGLCERSMIYPETLFMSDFIPTFNEDTLLQRLVICFKSMIPRPLKQTVKKS